MKSFKKKVILGLAALALAMPFTNAKANTVKYDVLKDSVESVCDESDVCTTSFKITVKHDIADGYNIGNGSPENPGTSFKITPKSAQIEKITNVKVTLADGYTGENGETELPLGEGLAVYEFLVKSEETIPANQVQTIATVTYNHAKDMDDCSVSLAVQTQKGEVDPDPIPVPDPVKPTPGPDTGVSVPAIVLGGTAIVALGVYAVTTKKSKIKNI